MKLLLFVIALVLFACRTVNKTKSERLTSNEISATALVDSIGTRKHETVKVTETFTDKKTGFNVRINYRAKDTTKAVPILVQSQLKNSLADQLTSLEWLGITTDGQEVESIEVSGDITDKSTVKQTENHTGVNSSEKYSKQDLQVEQTEKNRQTNKTSKGFASAGWFYFVCGLIVVILVLIRKLRL